MPTCPSRSSSTKRRRCRRTRRSTSSSRWKACRARASTTSWRAPTTWRQTALPLAQGGTDGYLGSALDAQGIALIAGLQAVLGAGVTSFNAGDIILGGDGSDMIMGHAGDDIIDGDKWLNVQHRRLTHVGDGNGGTGAPILDTCTTA